MRNTRTGNKRRESELDCVRICRSTDPTTTRRRCGHLAFKHTPCLESPTKTDGRTDGRTNEHEKSLVGRVSVCLSKVQALGSFCALVCCVCCVCRVCCVFVHVCACVCTICAWLGVSLLMLIEPASQPASQARVRASKGQSKSKSERVRGRTRERPKHLTLNCNLHCLKHARLSPDQVEQIDSNRAQEPFIHWKTLFPYQPNRILTGGLLPLSGFVYGIASLVRKVMDWPLGL